MAREFSKLQTAQKSRGWLRFRRFFDEIDRVAPNFFFENFTPSEKILLNRSGPRSARDRSETEDRTGPDRISVPIRRTGRTKRFSGVQMERNAVTALTAEAKANSNPKQRRTSNN